VSTVLAPGWDSNQLFGLRQVMSRQVV